MACRAAGLLRAWGRAYILHSMRRLLGRVALLFTVGACSSSLPPPPHPAADEGRRRQQELDWLVAALERLHPDLHSVTPRPEFERVVAEVRRSLPAATPEQAFVGLLRVVALGGDSHTRLPDLDPVAERMLPVVFGAWPEAFWTTAAQPDRPDLYARELLSLDGHSAGECIAVLGALVPHENEQTLRRGVARLLQLPQLLHAVGLTQDDRGATLTLRDLNGIETTERVDARPRAALLGWAAFAPPGWSEPLYRSRMAEAWWWTVLEPERTLYFQFNRCEDSRAAPFADAANAILERLDRGDLDRLVVDLRHNGGGDSGVLAPLLEGLARRSDWRDRGRIDVLIGSATYSSAMLNAWSLAEKLGARLVGEPTLQKPNSFGELRSFHLPFSGIRVDCATRRFRLLPNDPPALEPHLLIPTTFADLYHGRDPVL